MAVLDPLTRIPEDLVGVILHSLLEDAPNFVGKAEQLNIITGVCCSWRRAALSDPSLWAEVNWRLPTWTIQTFYRSASHDLDVVIDQTSGGPFITNLFRRQGRRMSRSYGRSSSRRFYAK